MFRHKEEEYARLLHFIAAIPLVIVDDEHVEDIDPDPPHEVFPAELRREAEERFARTSKTFNGPAI